MIRPSKRRPHHPTHQVLYSALNAGPKTRGGLFPGNVFPSRVNSTSLDHPLRYVLRLAPVLSVAVAD